MDQPTTAKKPLRTRQHRSLCVARLNEDPGSVYPLFGRVHATRIKLASPRTMRQHPINPGRIGSGAERIDTALEPVSDEVQLKPFRSGLIQVSV